jgi:hypothetical protein
MEPELHEAFSLISSHRRRFTENDTIKASNSSFPKTHVMSPFFHALYRDLDHTLQSP